MFGSKQCPSTPDRGSTTGWLAGFISIGLVVGAVALPAIAEETPAPEEATSVSAPEAPATEFVAEEAAPEATEEAVIDQPLETVVEEAEEAVIDEPLQTVVADPEPATEEPAAPAAEEPAPAEAPAPVVEEPAAPANAGQPSIATNRDNYYPGSAMIVTGSGWDAGELVALSLREVGESAVLATAEVRADESGAFSQRLELPDVVIPEARISALGDSGKTTEGINVYRGTK